MRSAFLKRFPTWRRKSRIFTCACTNDPARPAPVSYTHLNAGKFKVLTGSVADGEFAIGMRKGDTALVEAVNTALNELAQEGVLAEISTKWFGSDITLIGK